MKTMIGGLLIASVLLAGCGDRAALARSGGCLAVAHCGQAAAAAPLAEASPAPARGLPGSLAVF